LAAGGEDVSATRTPHKRWYTRPHQDALESRYPVGRWGGEIDPGSGIQGDQVHFAPQPAQQGYNLLYVAYHVDTIEAHIIAMRSRFRSGKLRRCHYAA
jgi:hypothetical protein